MVWKSVLGSFWENNGQAIKETGKASVRSEELYFQKMIGWTDISSHSQLGVRYYPDGFIFDASGPSLFPQGEEDIFSFLHLLFHHLQHSL